MATATPQEKAAQVAKDFALLCNGSSSTLEANLTDCILGEHRTIQASMIRTLVRVLRSIGENDKVGTDARNEDAIGWCRVLANTDEPGLARDPVVC